MIPLLFATLFPNHSHSVPDAEAHVDDGEKERFHNDDGMAQESASEEKKTINYPLVFLLFFGDFFHNFSDGVIIGTAFLGCDKNLAYTIVEVTFYHWVTQEIADFLLYTRYWSDGYPSPHRDLHI